MPACPPPRVFLRRWCAATSCTRPVTRLTRDRRTPVLSAARASATCAPTLACWRWARGASRQNLLSASLMFPQSPRADSVLFRQTLSPGPACIRTRVRGGLSRVGQSGAGPHLPPYTLLPAYSAATPCCTLFIPSSPAHLAPFPLAKLSANFPHASSRLAPCSRLPIAGALQRLRGEGGRTLSLALPPVRCVQILQHEAVVIMAAGSVDNM